MQHGGRGLVSEKLRLLLSLLFRRLLEHAWIDQRDVGLLSGEQVFDSQDLKPRILTVIGLVEARLYGLPGHRSGGRGQGDEHADLGVLAFDDMTQVADHGDIDIGATLDGDDGLFSFLAFGLEINQAVDAAIRALLFPAVGNGIDQRYDPPLELILVLCR